MDFLCVMILSNIIEVRRLSVYPLEKAFVDFFLCAVTMVDNLASRAWKIHDCGGKKIRVL